MMRESDLLRFVYAQSGDLPASVAIPPGDDMGGVMLGDRLLLVTVDQLAGGVHFDPLTASLLQIGHKAMARNLSDVAAMAAKPIGAVVATALPRGMSQDDAQRLFNAMQQTGQRFGCPLFGGDITIWDQPMMVTVTVLAEPAGIEPVTRDGAKPGDHIYVTGTLGGSLLDLDGHCHHLDFQPRIALARTLAGDKATRPTSMIDLSDGLAIDLGRLCEQSKVCAQLEIETLPISLAAKRMSQTSKKPAWQHALGDGEDYELCFTAPPELAMPNRMDDVGITRVGQIVKQDLQAWPVMLHLPDGSELPGDDMGWEHGR